MFIERQPSAIKSQSRKQQEQNLSTEKYLQEYQIENPYREQIQHQITRKSLVTTQRQDKSSTIRFPVLRNKDQYQRVDRSTVQNMSQPKFVNKLLKDYGLSEDEKQTYGDRFPGYLKKMDVLGKGGFALVWLADNKENNIKYAVKQISRQVSSNTIFQREQRFYQHFFYQKNNRNVDGFVNLVEILDIEVTNRDIWIIQELGGKTLSKAMYNLKGEFFKGERVYSITETSLTQTIYKKPQLFVQILQELLRGISFIHKEGFIHCDLKPENILIKWNEETQTLDSIKIIDYGSSFTFNDQDNIGMVTPEYMAPEVLEIIHNWGKHSNHYKNQIAALKSLCDLPVVDVWSYGAVILDMLVGIPHWLSYKGKIVKGGRVIVKTGLFATKGRELDKILQKQFQISQQIEQIVFENALFLNGKSKKLLIDFLQQILIVNPAQRATPQNLLNHEFFS